MTAKVQDCRNEEIWGLAERLITSLIERMRRIDVLAPAFPSELYKARDVTMEGLMVADYLERFARHSQQHAQHIASIRAAIGRARPTEPSGDTERTTGRTYASVWYQWFLVEALLRRTELVAQLVGLTDADLDRMPSPEFTAGSTKTIRQVCEHVLQAEDWKMRGIEDALSHYRASSDHSTEK